MEGTGDPGLKNVLGHREGFSWVLGKRTKYLPKAGEEWSLQKHRRRPAAHREV